MAEKALRDDFQKFEKTEIDDEFFSLREMEKFCDEEDEKEMNDEMDEDLDEELQDELYGEGALEDEDEDDEKGAKFNPYAVGILNVASKIHICLV